MSSQNTDGASLRRLLALGYVFHEAVAVRLGINATDLKCLALAAGEESVTPTRLAELAGLTSGAITGVLDRLEQAGIVSREPDPSDRRRVVVHVADERLREIGALYDPVLADALPADARARTAAEAQVVALSGALERATARLRAETRGGMVDDRTFIAPLAGATHGRLVFISGAPRLSMTAAPFGAGAVARVVMETSASRLTLSAADGEEHLLRAGFEGGAPDIRAEDGVVTVRYRRSRLDFQSRHARIGLNPSIPWTVEVRGGVTDLVGELRAVPLAGLSVDGGVNHLSLSLPPPTGTVRLEVNGGSSDAVFERPAGTDISVRARGVVSSLSFDDVRRHNVSKELRMQSRGFGRASDRYELDLRGGAARLRIDTL
ncbi:MAG TPA: MarR family transcriptional regulator [Candidatus Limnocylindria bacterium]